MTRMTQSGHRERIDLPQFANRKRIQSVNNTNRPFMGPPHALPGPARVTIRKKIFLLAGILLALFGVVVGVLAVIQKLDSDEINNIAEYELPLTRLVAEI